MPARPAAPSRPPLLPPAVRGWPSPLLDGGADAARPSAPAAAVAEALARIRAEALFWPAPQARAARPRALALDAAGLDAARTAYADADIARGVEAAAVDPERLEAVFGAGAAARWARLGGLGAPACAADPAAMLAAGRGVCPWRGAPIGLGDAVEAAALLRRAATRARGPVGLVAMSPWKRRCLRPFLTGPDGPPRAVRSAAEATARGLRPAIWGAGDGTPPGALRIEDGFLRSVGLGLRHTPPLSLAIDAGAPYFDATRPNAFEATAAAAALTPALLARARRLREAIVAAGLTKYNLAGTGAPALPDRAGRTAVLIAGQVESDASIRLGALGPVRSNAALVAAARARWPDACLVYKPHPDVLTGLRPGAVEPARLVALGVGEAAGVAAESALDWADRVATMTSLIGFEALLRGKAVSTFGRPFYAGWGLTDDADPPPRPTRLALDALVAVALILYPAYVDPRTGLPCPVETALAALADERARARRPAARLRRLWRDSVSAMLARIGT